MAQLDQNTIDEMLRKSQQEKNDTSSGDGALVISEMEKDAIGESFNISMGAAAKAMALLLNMRVLITTPDVSVLSSNDFEYKSMVPAVGVKIDYVEGLNGSNFLVMKQTDVKKVVSVMMGGPSDVEDDGEFNEIDSSAISEIMNQMMGAAATALATFFNRKINISPPQCAQIESNTDSSGILNLADDIVVVKLKLYVGDIIDSEIIHIMPVPFAKDLAKYLIETQLESLGGSSEPEAVIEKQQPERITNQSSQSNIQTNIHKEKIIEDRPMKTTNNTPQPKISTATFDRFDDKGSSGGNVTNLDLIMDVQLDITVEIGKTKRQVKEIMEFTQGTIIELEKQAGDPVDIIVNGELIARGDVVVIDDNFGVRITEIINKND